MPKKLNIKQVTLKKVTITASDQTLTLKFPFSHRVAEALGWAQELPEMTGTWSPDAPHNRVEVRTIEFRPTDETQIGRAFQLECHGYMENFAVIRKAAKGKDSKKAGIKKTDVTCTVAFADENGAGMLTNYMRAVPTSNVSISYDPPAVQDDLPGTDAPEDPDQPTFDGFAKSFDNPETTLGIEPQPELTGTGYYVAINIPAEEDAAESPQDEAQEGDGTEETPEPSGDEPAAPMKRGRGRPRKNA